MKLNDRSLLKDQIFIAGLWQDGSSVFDVKNPANGDVIARVASIGQEATRRAVLSAYEALPLWGKETAKARANILRKWYDLILENIEDLAQIMTAEQGKPLAEARAEITYAASFVEWFAEEAKRVYGDIIPTNTNDRRLITIKQPIGVVAAITPWNFPSAMLTRKVAPALAAGCTIVVKPAKETPLSALALAELGRRAGIPAGVLNVVTGKSASEIGAELTSNPLVRKLTFTGSTQVGKHLIRQCADTVKKVSMELGGNAPLIIFEDADMDKAVEGVLASKYRNAGQTCICANRILVSEVIYDIFAKKLASALRQYKLGSGFGEETMIGPLISKTAVDDVDGFVQDALTGGAKAFMGARRSKLGDCYYEPTILTNVTQDMRVFREEIFGPVAPLFSFKDEAQALQMANDTPYGLAAYFYTQNLGRIWRVSEALEYGMIGVNEVGISNEAIPFGGIKQSGTGREGSRYGIDEYLEIKHICLGGLELTDNI